MSEKEKVSPEIFAAVWQTSKSTAEVAHKLDISLSEANKMAKAFSRANGLTPHPPQAPNWSQGMRPQTFKGTLWRPRTWTTLTSFVKTGTGYLRLMEVQMAR